MEARDYLQFEIERNIKYLFKNYIECIEDIKYQHDRAFNLLMDSLPEEHKAKVIQSSFFGEDAYAYYRKKILDNGNAAIRANDTILTKFEVDFKR